MITKSFLNNPIGNYVYRENWNYPIEQIIQKSIKSTPLYTANFEFEIKGTTKINDQPESCIIQVFDKQWNLLYTEKSDSSGVYSVGNVHENEDYYILCIPIGDDVCPKISGKVKPTRILIESFAKIKTEFSDIEEFSLEFTTYP